MRTRYRQINGKLVKIDARNPGDSRFHFISPDIEAFVSPVDGTVIGSRSDLENHNKRHDVIQCDEWGNQTEIIQRDMRERQVREDKQGRIEALKHAIDKHKDNQHKSFTHYVEAHNRRAENGG